MVSSRNLYLVAEFTPLFGGNKIYNMFKRIPLSGSGASTHLSENIIHRKRVFSHGDPSTIYYALNALKMRMKIHPYSVTGYEINLSNEP